MNNEHVRSNRSEITSAFNLGFRRAANDRAAAGIEYAGPAHKNLVEIPQPPPPPVEWNADKQEAWNSGYRMGYKLGASDAELAGVEVPGACGMISGMGEQILEMMGLLTPNNQNM